MKCSLTICTCNIKGKCVYRGSGLTCQKIARIKHKETPKVEYGNFYREDC